MYQVSYPFILSNYLGNVNEKAFRLRSFDFCFIILKNKKHGDLIKKIAINGFGRIGRAFLRSILLDENAKKKLDVVAINIGPGDPNLISQLFQFRLTIPPPIKQ